MIPEMARLLDEGIDDIRRRTDCEIGQLLGTTTKDSFEPRIAVL